MHEELKKEIIKYGKIAGKKNYTPGISGNISARLDDKILITSSGSANGYLQDDDLVWIDFEGNIVEGKKKPSSEKMLHIEFYKQRPDINCIFHVHSPYLTAFAIAGIEPYENVHSEIVYCFGKIPLAEYALPGSNDLVRYTSKYFNKYDAVLMGNHGAIIGGENIKDTYLKLELCEAHAQSLICSKILGGARILQDDEVKKIYSLKQG